MRHLKAVDLSGLWQFAFSEDDPSPRGPFDHYQAVPGCFDVTPDFAGRRGVGLYNTQVTLDEGFTYRLRAAIAHDGVVYLDGREIDRHHGAHTFYELDLPKTGGGWHELVIAADNRFDGLNRPLHMPHFDWYQHGGLIRPVELIPYRQALIESVIPTVEDVAAGKVSLQIRFSITEESPSRLDAKVWIDHEPICEESFAADSGQVQLAFCVPNPQAWSPQSPHLHPMRIQLGDDVVQLNLGLRQIRTDGPSILLNGKHIAVKGVNRHNLHVQFGFALPPALLLEDAMLLKKLGANFVRGSHYPQDERFLQICDRLGLMVWSEATGWGYDEKDVICDPRMLAAQRQCIQEMIKQSADHPCVVCWGFFNECASDCPHARPVYEDLVGTIRQADPTRPVTFASNRVSVERGDADLMLDLVDWVSVNTYPGWYGGDLSNAAQYLADLADLLEKDGHTAKPILISEIGAGAIPGFVHRWPVKWSEDYQAELFRIVLDRIRTDERLTGVCIWQYCDIVTGDGHVMIRPRHYNNKGIVDEYRRPKQAFEAVRQRFGNW